MKFAVGDTVVVRDMVIGRRIGQLGRVTQAYLTNIDGAIQREMVKVKLDDGYEGEYWSARFDLVEARPLQVGDTVVWAGLGEGPEQGTVIKAWGQNPQ